VLEAAAQRIKDRLAALVDEVGRDAFITSLRKSLEDVEAEVPVEAGAEGGTRREE